MVVSVELPDAVASQLQLDGANGARHALEILAVEGYRKEQLSRGQVSELLQLSVYGTEELLKRHGAFLTLSLDEFRQETRDLEELLGA